jgi:hypothetical protein
MKLKSNIKLHGRVRAILHDAKTGSEKFNTGWQKNLIPTAGLAAILHRLANDAVKTNEGMITYGAVGSGAAITTPGDTIMENEIDRKAVSVTTVTGLDLNIEVFFTTAEGNGAITQWALFGEDASAAADSGTMFEHISFDTPFTKSSSETLTVEVTLSIS